MAKFLFSQRSGNSTTTIIVRNPKIEEGTVYTTKIGEPAGWSDKGKLIFKACKPVKFIAGGSAWTLTEFNEPLQ